MRTLWLLLVTGIGAWGCSCSAWPSAKGAWEESPLVFVGRVEAASFAHMGIGEQAVRVRVEEAFKGSKIGAVLELDQPGHNCAPKFKEGERVLFYLHPAKSAGKWEAWGCHRTQPLDAALDDLLFLRGLPGTAKGNRLSGVVVLMDSEWNTLRHLAGVKVRIQSGSTVLETVTNGEGLYEMYGLPPGKYTVQAEIPKGLKTSHLSVAGAGTRRGREASSEVELTATNGVSVGFWLTPDNALSGRVVDPEGKPMPGVCVDLELTDAPEKLLRFASACTKEEGVFTMRDAPTGTVRVVANKRGDRSGSTPFGKVYYPGTEDVSKAGVVTIREGEKVEGVEIRVPRLDKRIFVTGRVVYRDGTPAQKVSVDLANGNYGVRLVETDENGAFRAPLLMGKAGRIYGELNLYGPRVTRCEEYAKLALGRGFLTARTPEVAFAGEADLGDLVLTLPVGACR